MTIPKKAKKVFNGILFDVYHWEQKMFDGSFKTFEMLERLPTVDIITIANGKIITIIQEQPGRSAYPSLPGGAIEKNENPLEAAKRELLEETGYASSKIKLIDEYFGASKISFHEKVYLAKDCKKISEPNPDCGEKLKLKFLSFDEFLNLSRNNKFVAPWNLKFEMTEALLDRKKKEIFKKKLLY
ncbi:MAG: NUDIX domain-containing protein [bacterium]